MLNRGCHTHVTRGRQRFFSSGHAPLATQPHFLCSIETDNKPDGGLRREVGIDCNVGSPDTQVPRCLGRSTAFPPIRATLTGSAKVNLNDFRSSLKEVGILWWRTIKRGIGFSG